MAKKKKTDPGEKKKTRKARSGLELGAYREKRNFSATPEPAPGTAAQKSASGRPAFMVHKHDATRLHYDLRLETDGVLASWAVPKGPSFRPSDRRLAMRTEDHPLAYGGFEGRIPDGEYGAGDSLIWDRGTYETVPPGQAREMVEKGHLVFELHGEKLKGRWHLVRTGKEEDSRAWLLFKSRDEHATTRFDVVEERPESVVSGRRITRGPIRAKVRDAPHPDPMDLLLNVWPPMLASLPAGNRIEPGDCLLEVKYDGFRALAAVSVGKLSLQSRNGLDFSSRFPSIARALRALPVPEAVLDGEIVALDPEGFGSFQALQNVADEVTLKGKASRSEAEPGGLRYMAFDLLWLDGEDLRDRPVEDRRDLLESVLSNAGPPIEVAERFEGSIGEALLQARARRGEGVIAKKKGSRYRGGRSRDWLKLKVAAAQEFAIAGYTPITSGAAAIGALHLAVYHPGEKSFHYAGKVGTGFSDKVRRALWKELEADRVPEPRVIGAPRPKDSRWVVPRLVAQVAFGEWTRDGRIRHPSFQGLRMDKAPEECVREDLALPAADVPAEV